MRLILVIVAAVALVAAAGAYFYFVGREYEFRFTEEELQEKLSARLPITKRYLFVVVVTLDRPRVALQDGSDRVNAGLDVTLNLRIRGEAKHLGGTIDVSGGIRYDKEAGQFFMTDPVIEHLAVQGIPAAYTDRTNKALTVALAEYFSDRPIYTLNKADVKQAVAALVLKDVVVEGEELVVTIGI